jgi:ABC-type transporter Mla subunit MlaD
MQKQAPSVGRLLVAVGFTLSCFGLLLFLWAAFGGPIPFASKSYEFTADFPEAVQLAIESDVRIGGVSVGKVKKLSLPSEGNATRATIELDSQYAPLATDTRAILRQKTLLGETYIELTPGSPLHKVDSGGSSADVGGIDVKHLVGKDAVNPIPEGGHLASTQVQDATQIDEIFNALDKETRTAFQQWQQNAAIAIKGRGLDLNDAFGNLGPFASDASKILAILDRQQRALSRLVRSTGDVFGALSERDGELAGAITGSNATFGALASENQALADTFQIFPTFERESRATLVRLDKFAHNTDPFVRDLTKVAPDITSTLRSVRRLSPNLEHLFRALGPLIDASCGRGSTNSCSQSAGLASLRRFLDGLAPVLKSLDPFLANFNPILRYLDFYKSSTPGDFLTGPPAGMSGTLPFVSGQPAPRHALRQISYLSSESLSLQPQRPDTNRGNGYITPAGIGSPQTILQNEIFSSFDCDNTGNPGNGQVTYFPASAPKTPHGGEIGGNGEFAPCTISPDFPTTFGGGHAPQVYADP